MRNFLFDIRPALMKRIARKAIPYTWTEYYAKIKRYFYFNRFWLKYNEKWIDWLLTTNRTLLFLQ